MTNYLDHEGIFKVRPVSWQVKEFSSSNAVAIAIEFVVLERLDDGEWTDISSGYAEVRVWGDYFVTTKDGKPNTKTVEQLSLSLGWNGSFAQVVKGPPPSEIVQVTVKPDTYNGQTRFKAGWMNPGDFVPEARGSSPEEVASLDARFGSLLRAAASGAKKPAPTAKAPAPKPAAAKAPVRSLSERAESPEIIDPDSVPF